MTRKFTVFCDMDEVLVDFRGGACRVHGISPEKARDLFTPGTWDMTELMGISNDEFWEPIHRAGERFWLDLEWLPWRDDLLEFVNSIADEWYIVTAPSRCDSSYSGKVKYLKNFFGSSFDKFLLTPHKHLFARYPNALLIDDRETNVQKFCSQGGDALVFPSIGNTLHEYADKPVDYLRSIFELFP